jgi:hypothetical protein
MAQDFMHYEQMVQAAYRGIVRDALARVAKEGLRGAHHFYIVFRTDYPGVGMSDTLRGRYPAEMPIVIQHEYWNLAVHEDYFEVGLSFNKMPETLRIPFLAITRFVDPGVQFGIEFDVPPQEGAAGQVPGVAEAKPPAAEKAPAEKAPAEKPAAPGAVVSLDAFRKK